MEGNPFFEAVARHEGFYSQELMERLAETGSLHDLDGAVPEWAKRLFVTSHGISPERHVRMQAAFQRYTDNAVSKTINFPSSASDQDIGEAYTLAYELGCKGITIYRDGSKDNQVLSTGDTGKQPVTVEGEAGTIPLAPGEVLTPRGRPQEMMGRTERIRTGHGNMYITVNFDDAGKLFEVFTTLGKAGGCDSAQLEAISRLVSLALRSGVDMNAIVAQLRGITCCPAWDNGVLVRSAPDAVALALQRHISADAKEDLGASDVDGSQLKLFASVKEKATWDLSGALPRTHCPDCNTQLAFQEGCLLCTSCGWNKCG